MGTRHHALADRFCEDGPLLSAAGPSMDPAVLLSGSSMEAFRSGVWRAVIWNQKHPSGRAKGPVLTLSQQGKLRLQDSAPPAAPGVVPVCLWTLPLLVVRPRAKPPCPASASLPSQEVKLWFAGGSKKRLLLRPYRRFVAVPREHSRDHWPMSHQQHREVFAVTVHAV